MNRIVFRPLADDDLDRLYHFLYQRSEPAADSYVGDIIDAITRLADLPYSAPQRLDNYQDVRVASIRNHIVLYRPFSDGHGIEVLRVVHAAQDWANELRID
jgi:plasmid stabilization system protein ParE